MPVSALYPNSNKVKQENVQENSKFKKKRRNIEDNFKLLAAFIQVDPNLQNNGPKLEANQVGAQEKWNFPVLRDSVAEFIQK